MKTIANIRSEANAGSVKAPRPNKGAAGAQDVVHDARTSYLLATLTNQGWLPGIATTLTGPALAHYVAGEIPEPLLGVMRDAIEERMKGFHAARAKSHLPKPAAPVQLLLPFSQNESAS